MKFLSAVLFVFTVFCFNASAQQQPDPDYTRLETVVRLKETHGRDPGSQDYLGLSLMFETRDRVSKSPVWAADVAFGPRDPRTEIFYEAGAFSWAIAHEALVLMRYSNIPGYASEVRNYGTKRPTISDPRNDGNCPLIDDTLHHLPLNPADEMHPVFKIQHIGWDFKKEGVPQNSRKNWLNSSLFEWTLRDTLTISDLQSSIQAYKDLTYRYTLAGFSCRANIINCCQFSCIVLKNFDINLDTSSMIRKYTNNEYGMAGWYVVSAIPLTLIGGSFTPSDVVEEILKNRANIGGTRIITVTPRAGNLIVGRLFSDPAKPKNNLIKQPIVRNQGVFHITRHESLFRGEILERIVPENIGNYDA